MKLLFASGVIASLTFLLIIGINWLSGTLPGELFNYLKLYVEVIGPQEYMLLAIFLIFMGIVNYNLNKNKSKADRA